MATVYKIELVSHWINYPPEELEKILTDAMKAKENNPRSEVKVKVKRV